MEIIIALVIAIVVILLLKPKKKKHLNINENIIIETKCPYCKIDFDSIPLRTRKCPHCRNKVVVSKVENNVLLFTEDEWVKEKVRRKAESFVKKWLKKLEYYGISRQDFERHKNISFKKHGFHKSDSDTLWGLMNELVLKKSTKGELDELSSIYYIMSRFLYEEGKDHLKLAQLSTEFKLKEHNFDIIEISDKLEIMGCADSCSECMKLNGKVITYEEAIKLKPIPCPTCTNEPSKSGRGWCRCCYVNVVND